MQVGEESKNPGNIHYIHCTYMTVSIFLVAIFGTDFYMAANSELREERGVGRAKGEKVWGIQGVGR